MTRNMPGRISARSSVNHNSASSPPKRVSRREQDLAARVTRLTRSQTRELGSSDVRQQQSARTRGVRHASEDSDTSIEIRPRRRRKSPGAAAATSRELPIVAEDPEVVRLGDENEGAMINVAKHVKDNKEEEQPGISQSPGGLSTLSGTTALTSHSVQEMADLDLEMIVKLIPALFRDTSQLLELLVPGDVTPINVQEIVRELQVPGSSRGKMLRYVEETFNITRKNFGSEMFINTTIVLRKLFNNQDPGMEDSRPDVVLHAANIATLVKGLLVAQRDSPSTMPILQRLDDLFPSPFLSCFESNSQFGSSVLVDRSFDFALELRTQTVISILMAFRGDPNYDPDQLIAQIFCEPPAQRNPSLNTYEDSVLNGEFRRIGGSTDSWPISKSEFSSQSIRIRDRVEAIRESFHVDAQAMEDGDYVDFDQLHNKFPWIDFIVHAMKWSQVRIEEINKNIETQGGSYNIATTLAEEIQNLNSQIKLNYEPPRAVKPTGTTKRSLLAMTNIIPASIGKSLYKSSKSVKALLKTTGTTPSDAPSNQQTGEVTQDIISSIPKSARLKNQENERPHLTDPIATGAGDSRRTQEQYIEDSEPLGDSDIPQAPQERSTAELLADFREAEAYQNKENRPLHESKDPNTPKRRFIDRQPNAQRIAWSQPSRSEVEHTTPRGKKRNHQALSDDTTSEDEGFQYDDRIIDIPRRQPVRTTRGSMVTARSPHKRARKQSPDELEPETVPRASSRPEDQLEKEKDSGDLEAGNDVPVDEDALQASARANAEGDDEENDEGEEIPTSTAPPSYAVISETAKEILRQKHLGAPRKARQRIPWSENDTELLINLIGAIGCSWAAMEERGDFEHMRDQVALRDKARNIKVDFLRARVELLPAGFDGILLGKKERDRVRAVGENPFRKEEERPGEEAEGPESP